MQHKVEDISAYGKDKGLAIHHIFHLEQRLGDIGHDDGLTIFKRDFEILKEWVGIFV